MLPDGSNLFDQTVFDQTNLMFDQTDSRQTSQEKKFDQTKLMNLKVFDQTNLTENLIVWEQLQFTD